MVMEGPRGLLTDSASRQSLDHFYDLVPAVTLSAAELHQLPHAVDH